MFGPEACSTLLLFKLETTLWKYIKPFMEYLNIFPPNELKDILSDKQITEKLKVI